MICTHKINTKEAGNVDTVKIFGSPTSNKVHFSLFVEKTNITTCRETEALQGDRYAAETLF